jgi:molecular chaperone DnaK
MITGLSRKPEGNEIIDTFELDKNGILHVTAIEKCTGKSKKIEIDNAMAKLDKKEMDKARGKIGELFSSQSDFDIDGEYAVVDEENQEEAEQKGDTGEAVKAEALIKKAEALMDDAETEDQEELVELVEAIRDALKAADGARLGESMHELNEIIFYLES